MKRWLCLVVLLVLTLPAVAQDKALPRVLIIGDEIYSQHCRGATAALKGKADVVMAAWPQEAVANSSTVLEHLDVLLGYHDRNGKPLPKDKRPKWDLIHVNVGLGDLIHRAPTIETFRVMPIHMGGAVTTSKQQYADNLEELIRKLKATGAQVVWASTTPIRHSRSNVFEKGSELAYNAIAGEVMAKHGVAVNDMYRFTSHLINMDKPAGHGADPFSFDKKPIHIPVVRVIEAAFGLEPLPETEEEKSVKEALAKPEPAQG